MYTLNIKQRYIIFYNTYSLFSVFNGEKFSIIVHRGSIVYESIIFRVRRK